jgi:hypothetical protein
MDLRYLLRSRELLAGAEELVEQMPATAEEQR